jgi:hypothetical protein
MEFPETLYISECGSGDDAYLGAAETEREAIKATDDEIEALVAEYKLVAVRNRKIESSVVDAVD